MALHPAIIKSCYNYIVSDAVQQEAWPTNSSYSSREEIEVAVADTAQYGEQ